MNNYNPILKALDERGYLLTVDIPITDEMESNIMLSVFNALASDELESWTHPNAKLISLHSITRP